MNQFQRIMEIHIGNMINGLEQMIKAGKISNKTTVEELLAIYKSELKGFEK